MEHHLVVLEPGNALYVLLLVISCDTCWQRGKIHSTGNSPRSCNSRTLCCPWWEILCHSNIAKNCLWMGWDLYAKSQDQWNHFTHNCGTLFFVSWFITTLELRVSFLTQDDLPLTYSVIIATDPHIPEMPTGEGLLDIVALGNLCLFLSALENFTALNYPRPTPHSLRQEEPIWTWFTNCAKITLSFFSLTKNPLTPMRSSFTTHWALMISLVCEELCRVLCLFINHVCKKGGRLETAWHHTFRTKHEAVSGFLFFKRFGWWFVECKYRQTRQALSFESPDTGLPKSSPLGSGLPKSTPYFYFCWCRCPNCHQWAENVIQESPQIVESFE